MKNLNQQIEELNENLAVQLSTEILEVLGQSIQDLKSKNIEENCIGIGNLFPDFNLPNSNNEIVRLKELLQKGKVIVAFFRGSWCPYCNLELKALQDSLKQITDKKATLSWQYHRKHPITAKN
jgi:cytochrome oxidase Cu insertion factor (SCO1/SenC/PrrC family)